MYFFYKIVDVALAEVHVRKMAHARAAPRKPLYQIGHRFANKKHNYENYENYESSKKKKMSVKVVP